ncbi:hypothetical protein EMGBS6_03250 [Opitutia bacterium]|nr:hypothetical protein EMGBS6_03250 [Opitutae bacterium]
MGLLASIDPLQAPLPLTLQAAALEVGVFVMESQAQSSTSLRSAAGRAIIPAIITIIGL